MNLSLQESTVVRHELYKTLTDALNGIGLAADSPLRRVGDFFARSGAILPGAQKAEEKIKRLMESSANLPKDDRALLLVATTMMSSKPPIPSRLLPAVASMSGLGSEEVTKLNGLVQGRESNLKSVFEELPDISLDL